MKLSRRGFLTGMVAVAAASQVPAFAEEVPILWGDLVHDDTAAINALLDGKPIIRDGVLFRPVAGESITLRGGSYLMSKPVTIRKGNTFIFDAHFRYTGQPDCMLRFSDGLDKGQNSEVGRCTFDGSDVVEWGYIGGLTHPPG